MSTEACEPLPGDPFALIRSSCTHAASVAKFVTVDTAGLAAFCSQLPVADVKSIWAGSMGENSDTLPYESFPSSREACNYAVLFSLMQIGHGFRYELHQARAGAGASKTITTGIGKLAQGPLTAARLAALTLAETDQAFGLPSSVPGLAPLRPQIHGLLRETGSVLLSLNKLDMYDLVLEVLSSTEAETAGPASALVCRLASVFPGFCDRGQLSDGSTVWLLKKAQLAVGELQRILGPHDPRFKFSDIDRMTAIVDNVVPAMLVHFGVLKLDPALSAHIKSRQPLPRGPQEAELRAVALRACDLICESTNRQFNSGQLAYYLWKLGKEGENRRWERHLTKDTIYY